MTRSTVSGFLLAAVIALVPCSNAEAQLGGLKKQLKEAVKGTDPSPEGKQAGQGNRLYGDPDVLEISEPVLEDFTRGLKAELALQKEFLALLATYPTQEEYKACQDQAAQSEEAQKLFAMLMNMPEGISAAEAQRITTKVTTEMGALVKRRCPLDPDEWPPEKRIEKLKAIQLRAAEAAGPDSRPSGRPKLDGDGPARGPAGASEPLPAAGITIRAYEILKERIIAYCASTRGSQDASQGVKIPGTGINIFFVYSAGEAAALQGRCQLLMSLIGQLM